MPQPLVHFEIHATDPESVISFYKTVFGWDIQKWEGGEFEYWMVMTCPKDTPNSINGGLVRRRGDAPKIGAPVNGCVPTMLVEDYDKTAEIILSNGGTEALPKMTIADMAYQGYFHDPDKNIFGIHQPIKKASTV